MFLWWYSSSIPADSSICCFIRKFVCIRSLFAANYLQLFFLAIVNKRANRKDKHISSKQTIIIKDYVSSHRRQVVSSNPEWQECQHVEDPLKHSEETNHQITKVRSKNDLQQSLALAIKGIFNQWSIFWKNNLQLSTKETCVTLVIHSTRAYTTHDGRSTTMSRMG